MATIATRPTDGDVTAFIDSVPDPHRRADAHALRSLFERLVRNAWQAPTGER